MSESNGRSITAIVPIAADAMDESVVPVGGKSIPWGSTWVILLSFSAIMSSILVVGLHSQRGFFIPVLTTGICILAALFDAWTTRIPNALTYGAIVAGLIINLASSGLARFDPAHGDTVIRWLAAPGISQSLWGFGVCAALASVGLIAGVGGGDIKLLAGVGALLGLAGIGSVLVVAMAVAFVYAVLNLALFGRLKTFTNFVAVQALEFVYFRRFEMPAEDPAEAAKPALRKSVPMAVPLALGVLIAQVLEIQWRSGATGAGS